MVNPDCWNGSDLFTGKAGRIISSFCLSEETRGSLHRVNFRYFLHSALNHTNMKSLNERNPRLRVFIMYSTPKTKNYDPTRGQFVCFSYIPGRMLSSELNCYASAGVILSDAESEGVAAYKVNMEALPFPLGESFGRAERMVRNGWASIQSELHLLETFTTDGKEYKERVEKAKKEEKSLLIQSMEKRRRKNQW